ncbi:MAG: archaetidylserine decarboxylase [Holophagales bacterium]|jgi:phosphatidylserine decarboxylase|nr:archaetidylserine decarboxylase [Holophagales bacterium]
MMSEWPILLSLMRLYPKRLASIFVGWAASMRLPRPIRLPLLRWFACRYGIDSTEAEKPLDGYASLQEFFTRRLKPSARPQDEMLPGAINCPVDGRIVACGRIREGTLIQAKGLFYSLRELLTFMPLPERFEGGHYLTIYLSPKDYHRIHVPIIGTVQAAGRVQGELWPVNDAGVAHIPKLYERNRRAAWVAEGSGHDKGLLVACALVGATHVGSCVVDERWLGGRRLPKKGALEIPDIPCAPGDDLGLFQFGSTVILIVGGAGADAWAPEKDEGPVKVGQRLGRYR